MAYNKGYCRDYEEWLRADKGFKEELTVLNNKSWEKLLDLLNKLGSPESRYQRFRREGNIFYPE